MSAENRQPVGSIGWVDLTVEDAERIRDFYRDVVGWKVSGVNMGGYSDYCMNEPESDRSVAGVCHARGGNAGLPPQWLLYISVENLDESTRRCVELGGALVAAPRSLAGQGRYCVIRDPAAPWRRCSSRESRFGPDQFRRVDREATRAPPKE